MVVLKNKFDLDELIKGDYVLVDFYADWCGPCRMMGSVLEKISDIDVLKVNVDKFPELAQKYDVMSIPNLILLDNNQLVKNHIGFMNEDELKEFIK